MKINRFIALALIALLVVSAMGFISARGLAHGSNSHQQQVVATQAADTGNGGDQVGDQGEADTDTEDVDEQVGDQNDTDTDTEDVDEQVGEQVEDGQPDGAESPESEAPGAPDDGVQDPSYTGSVAVDQSQTEGMSEDDESAALQGQATISAAEAEAAALAANPGATVVKTELDNENGTLVYSVELNNGADVKVDAGNGSILFTDSDADGED
jgi:uncharacterized membrane protein YkoI